MQHSQVVLFFWKYVEEISDAERLVLLRWMSGLFCLPPGGFSSLPHFRINKDHGSLDRLPSVSTCSFSLYLPEYETFNQLATKLKQASQDFTFGRV
jgi:E3 ubiquitin-protein ligase HUWE1